MSNCTRLCKRCKKRRARLCDPDNPQFYSSGFRREICCRCSDTSLAKPDTSLAKTDTSLAKTAGYGTWSQGDKAS